MGGEDLLGSLQGYLLHIFETQLKITGELKYLRNPLPL